MPMHIIVLWQEAFGGKRMLVNSPHAADQTRDFATVQDAHRLNETSTTTTSVITFVQNEQKEFGLACVPPWCVVTQSLRKTGS